MRPARDGRRKRKPQRGKLDLRRDGDSYVLRIDRRELRLFDPEKCLKVGRHYGQLGIVYQVDTKGGEVDWQGDWHKTARGIVPRNGGEPEDLARAAAKLALKMAGMSSPARWLVEKLAVRWGDEKLWKDLSARLELGEELEVVSDVMGS